MDKKNETTITTNELVIEGHLLKWENVVVQISNISSVTTMKVIPPRFPAMALILTFVGIVLITVDNAGSSRYYYSSGSAVTAIGIALLILSIIRMLVWYSEAEPLMNKKYLSICTNSGMTYLILFRDEQFREKVLRVFTTIFAKGNRAGDTYYIDIKGGQIKHIGPNG